MNRDQLEGIVRQVSGAVKAQWGALVNDPLAVDAGIRDRLAGKILEQRAISRQDAERNLQQFLRRNRNWSDPSRH